MALLEVNDITVRFGGIVALNQLSFDMDEGQILGLIGPNGAGKTTMFNVVSRIYDPTEGTITYDGQDLLRLAPHKISSVGIYRTFQNLALWPSMTVLENVMVGAHRHAKAGFFSALIALPTADKDEKRLRERAHTALVELGAESYADRYPGSLPYPVQKRVALARALVADPELLLLDEPASGLAEDEMTELGDLIQTLSARMSVLLVEHHMDLVMRVCDQITVLDSGKPIAAGTPAEVQANPAVTEAYLGDEVDVEADAAELAHDGGRSDG